MAGRRFVCPFISSPGIKRESAFASPDFLDQESRISIANKGTIQLTISSSTKKYTPIYYLDIKYMNAQGKTIQEKKIESSFTRWFSADGVFHPEPFQQWLASEIEVLRLAAGESAPKKVETIMEEEEDVSSEPKKSGKSRKAKK